MWKKIVEFWQKITRKAVDFFKPNARLAVDVVNVLKELVNNPLLDVAINLTSTKWDNEVLAIIRTILPNIARKLLTAEVILEAGNKPNEIIAALVEYLRKQNRDVQAAFYIALAGKINEALADGKLSFAEAISLAQLVYAEYE